MSSVARMLMVAAMAGAVAITSAMAQTVVETDAPTTLSETYDSWTVQCVSTEGEPKRRNCQMSQELLQQESRQRVLLFAVTRTGAETKATLIMPFGLLLSDGLRLELADKELLTGAYRTCLPAGCVAEIVLNEAMITELQAGEKLSVVMTAVSGQPVRTELSLKGFSAAYRRLATLAG